jgi:putative Flp pilus-assembly TadE/G-like protein
MPTPRNKAEAVRRRGWPGRPARARREGQVLVLVLLTFIVLISLIFFVFNVGDQVNHRVVMQSAADAAAASGAGWIARTMNLVSLNNVAQARMISLALVLDSMPLAAEMAIAEETGENSLAGALDSWATAGSPFTPYERDNFLREGLAELHRQLTEGPDADGEEHYSRRQLELLKLIDEHFDSEDERDRDGGYELRRATHWSADGGSADGPEGSIWQATEALDEFSRAAADDAVELAQANAVRFAAASGVPEAVLCPAVTEFPGERRSFLDFAPVFTDHVYREEDPRNDQFARDRISVELVRRLSENTDTAWELREICDERDRYALHGGAIPPMSGELGSYDHPSPRRPYARRYEDQPPIHRIGPFASVYGWWLHGWQQGAGYGTTGFDLEQTRSWSFGPLEHAVRRVVQQFGQAGLWWGSGSADTSRFAYHLRTVATAKLAYLLDESSYGGGGGLDLRTQYSDEWITDYDQARAYHDAHDGEPLEAVMRTRYYRVRVKSTVSPSDSTHWLRTYETDEPTATYTPRRWYSWQLQNARNCAPVRPGAAELEVGNARIQPLHRWTWERRGWRDIPGGWQRLTDYVWFRAWSREREYDRELRLLRRFTTATDPQGQPQLDQDGLPIQRVVPYTIHFVEWRVFGGIELRNEQNVANLARGANLEDMPAPFILRSRGADGDAYAEEIQSWTFADPATGRERAAARVRPYEYLGVARDDRAPAAWRSRFRSSLRRLTHRSEPVWTFAMAQAKVFNNSSWDLWTQDWRTQLAPLENWDLWVDRMDPAQFPTPVVDGRSTADVASEAQRFMEAVPSELADLFRSQ